MPLTPDGLEIRTAEEIQAEYEADQRAAFGDDVEVGASSVLGNLNAVYADDLRQVEELLRAVYDSFDPRAATGDALERVAAYTGTTRRSATPSTVVLDVTADAGTLIAAGLFVAATSGPAQRRFISLDEINQPGPGSAVVSIAARSEEFGPVEAPAGSITVIAEPAPGVTAVTNPADADLGLDVETDAELRLRREQDLARAGKSTVDAIRSDVTDALTTETVMPEVVVFENQTDVTDPDGLPPHSVEVLVDDGTATGTLITEAEIAQAVFDARPAGIATFGTFTTDAFDSRGVARSTSASRPTKTAVEVEVTITRGPNWTTAVDDAIKAGLADYVDASVAIGDDLVLSVLSAQVLCGDIAKVPDEVKSVTLLQARVPPDPFDTADLVANVRERFTLDSTDVTVLETP